MMNLLDDKTNQPSKFRTRNWVEINNESLGTYNERNQIKFKTSMTRSNLCDYNDAYMHQGAAPNNRNKEVTFKNCVPFINYISQINNAQIGDAHDIDVVMPMNNLLEYSDIYSKTSESLWHYYKDEPALNDNNVTIDFPADNNNNHSFKFRQKITGQTKTRWDKRCGNNGPIKISE